MRIEFASCKHGQKFSRLILRQMVMDKFSHSFQFLYFFLFHSNSVLVAAGVLFNNGSLKALKSNLSDTKVFIHLSHDCWNDNVVLLKCYNLIGYTTRFGYYYLFFIPCI